jgi:predicted P-loop ATPase
MTDQKIKSISFYLSNGYALTPLCVYKPGDKYYDGKKPISKAWQHTAYDAFFECDGNYGVVLQDDDLIVDDDPRNYVPGVDSLSELMHDLGVEFKTRMVRTGSGGLHYYFKKPATTAVSGLLKKYHGIEFKTKGQQVVGAGSVTNDAYVVVNDMPVMDAPAELLALIARKQDVAIRKSDKKIEFTSDQQTQDRFISYVKQCPVALEGNRANTFYIVACHGRDLGLELNITSQLMITQYNPRCTPPLPAEEVFIITQNAYKYAKNDAGNMSPKADFGELAETLDDTAVSGWEQDKNNRLKPTFRNVINVLSLPNTEMTGVFTFNEFSCAVEFARPAPWHKIETPYAWSDNDGILFREWLSMNYSFAPAVSEIHEAVVAIAKRTTYHPVKKYLQSLKWDGIKRLDTWLVHHLGAADTIYTREVGQKVLCAAVRRIFTPGEKFDYLMVLEGAQGQGKSRLCKALGKQWHIGLKLDPYNKDFVDYMRSKWIVEIEEMDVASKAETQAIKAFLSRDNDRCRLAYARTTNDYPRQCIFIGTYNPIDGESTYLKDPTGNRRFWPITCGEEPIDVEIFESIVDQLWAEAVTKAKDEKLFLSKPANEECLILQKEKQERDPLYNLVAEWLEANTNEGQFISGLGVYQQCIGGKSEAFSTREGRRICNIMRLLGWVRDTRWSGKASIRGYRKPFIRLNSLDIYDL